MSTISTLTASLSDLLGDGVRGGCTRSALVDRQGADRWAMVSNRAADRGFLGVPPVGATQAEMR
jgi:hypothetical protein